MNLRRTAGWITAAIAVVSSTLIAQEVAPVANAPAAENRQQISRSVIRHVRDGEIQQALKSLESVASNATPIIDLDDGLSSACASLHKALSQLSSEAQFDLLSKWSMPADSPTKIRTLTMLTPTVTPPTEFARALGERPRNNAFPVASIGEVRGIFSSAWSLVIAAKDSGRLNRVITDVGRLVDQKTPNADLLMALALIAHGGGSQPQVAEQLSIRIARLQGADRPTAVDPDSVVLACAALQIPTLRHLGEEMLAALVDNTNGQSAAIVRPFLRTAHATAVLLNDENRSKASVASKMESRLKYWVPVSEIPEGSISPAMTNAVWLVHEDHILHLAGSGKDSLLFRYPLSGDFRFECETETPIVGQFTTDGGLIYGGRGYHVVGTTSEFCVTESADKVLGRRFCPFIRQPAAPGFNRLSIQSTPDAATAAINQHPMWTDKSGIDSSPWVGLKSLDEFRPLFRNLKITGQPVIPRSVQMSNSPELRGWQSQLFGERTDVKSAVDSRWSYADGMLVAAKPTSKLSSGNVEQLLAYQRPLLEGESISYDFFYEPGVCEINPALGRVAFLLQPDGIRLHWVTNGDRDWTGLTADNVVTEPLNRRGPRPLPFKMNDWNRVTLARTGAGVTLALNDVDVYQRPVDWTGDRRFGFYQPRLAPGAKVRNVILKGDWPETLPQDFLDNPTTAVGEPQSIAQSHALNRLLQEKFLAGNVSAVRRRALAMPVSDRFEFLSRWILPSLDHPGFRMTGEFTQTQPAPPAIEQVEAQLGGQVVSPVFDWLNAARELGRIAECRRRVKESVFPDEESQHRAQASLLMLLSLEERDATSVASDFEKLLSLLKAQTPVGIDDQWPETLVAIRGIHGFKDHQAVAELVSFLHLQRAAVSPPGGINLWHTHIAALFSQLQAQNADEIKVDQKSSAGMKDWIPVTAARSNSRGPGYPNLAWNRYESTVAKTGGHVEDYLFYRSPLSGDFEVECDFPQPMQSTSLIMTDGKCLGVQGDFKHLAMGSFGAWARLQPLDNPLTYIGGSLRYRAVVRDKTCSVFFNGRQVQTIARQEELDPWIAIRSWGRHMNRIHDFRITGQPEVLDAVVLSTSKTLTGWVEYHEESIIGDEGRWRHVDDRESSGWIVGRPSPVLAGTFTESLLRYQRPLVEDGSIEYEFFFEPGKIETHPALDRLALILHPTGVREHWITDGRYDRTDMSPDHVSDLPKCRRGPSPLPLKSGQWNQLKLVLHEATLSVELNEVLVYQRELEPENQRTFGLFRYADATEARVRNVIMRGDWPKAVPSVADQELADKSMNAIDADLTRLKSVFEHNFQKEGLPEKYFRLPPQLAGSRWKLTADGLEVNSTGTGVWTHTEISPRFTLSGDFDVEAQFDRLQMDCTKQSVGAQFNVVFSEPLKPDFGFSRLLVESKSNFLYASRNVVTNAGDRAWIARDHACESLSGRFRLARRGKQAFFLFADGVSENFQLLDTQIAPVVDTEKDGIRLHSLCQNVGVASAVWKTLRLRAERMSWHPDNSKVADEAVSIMQPDGKGLRTVVRAANAGFSHVSSPEWSSDGRKIAVEMSNGSKPTSHIIVVNADGSERRDLGPGCMPSFSADTSHLVCSVPRSGIVKLRIDGTGRQVIDAAGWGAQWSPDGKWIAYGKAGNITLLNVQTAQKHTLLTGDAATRYGYIYSNLGWSHDSRCIAFKARCREIYQDELVVAELDPDMAPKVLVSDARAVMPDFTFSPDNQQVLFGFEDPDIAGLQLHSVNRQRLDEIRMFPGQPRDQKVTGCAWSHDGKSIVLTGSNPVIEWISQSITDPSAATDGKIRN